MTDYVGHLQNENLPMPSLEPAAQAHGGLKHHEGVAARDTVVELAQRIVAMTMEPDMNLLVSSLQVSRAQRIDFGASNGIFEGQ